MKTYCVFCLALMLSTAGLLADPPVDTSGLPSPVQRTLSQAIGKGGKVQKVGSRRMDGQMVYEVEYKERGDEKKMLVAQDGIVLSSENSSGKGAKGKGKAKGRDKGVEERDIVSPQADSAPSQPTPTGSPVVRESASAPRTQSAAQVEQNSTVPRVDTSKTGTKPVLTKEMKAEFNRRIDRMGKLDDNRQAVAAGVVAIEKETGVARATLQTQLKSSAVGLSTLLIANEIAREKGESVTTIVKERRNGRTWETIAANHQYDMTTVFPKLERVEAAMANAAKQ